MTQSVNSVLRWMPFPDVLPHHGPETTEPSHPRLKPLEPLCPRTLCSILFSSGTMSQKWKADRHRTSFHRDKKFSAHRYPKIYDRAGRLLEYLSIFLVPWRVCQGVAGVKAMFLYWERIFQYGKERAFEVQGSFQVRWKYRLPQSTGTWLTDFMGVKKQTAFTKRHTSIFDPFLG